MEIVLENSWYDVFLLCLISTAVIFSIHAYIRAEKGRKNLVILTTKLDGQFKKIDAQFESVSKGFKDFKKAISDITDLIKTIQEDWNERFDWLYKQIPKDKDNP